MQHGHGIIRGMERKMQHRVVQKEEVNNGVVLFRNEEIWNKQEDGLTFCSVQWKADIYLIF